MGISKSQIEDFAVNVAAVDQDVQLVYLNFDGAETVYRNDDLDLAFQVKVQASPFDASEQKIIVDSLNLQYADSGIVFSASQPVAGEYSTVFIGSSDDFDAYGSFKGISETIDSGNMVKSDNAFVLTDSDSSVADVIETVKHEVGHIFEGAAHASVQGDLADYAAVVQVKVEKFFSSNFSYGNKQDLVARVSSDSVTVYRDGAAWRAIGVGDGWDVRGAGDFNGDGTGDFLVYHQASGTLGSWLMQADGSQGWCGIGPNPLDDSWDIYGVGDFDANGLSDVLLYWKEWNYLGLWQQGTDGLTYWQGVTQLSPGWEVAGVGDFNGDTRSDILLFHEGSNTLGAYLYNGGGSTTWATIGSFDNAWSFDAIGDFNGDGTDDILLYWEECNYQGCWLLNNGQQAGWGSIGQYNPSEWSFIGTGDCNGDGTDDLLLAAEGSEALGARLLNNGTVSGWLTIA